MAERAGARPGWSFRSAHARRRLDGLCPRTRSQTSRTAPDGGCRRARGCPDGTHQLERGLRRHTDGRVIDVMVADHLPSHIRARIAGRPAFRAPAGQQAINRREIWRLEFTPDVSCVVGVPNALGAIVAKGAAWIADNRTPERHLQDAATLLAAVGDASALDYRLSGSDRRRLRTIREHLGNARHPSWNLLDPDERRLGQQNLELIAGAAGL